MAGRQTKKTIKTGNNGNINQTFFCISTTFEKFKLPVKRRMEIKSEPKVTS